MSYHRHHAIIVTTYDPDLIASAHTKAVLTGLVVTDIAESTTNGFQTFLVVPDGSKEGWEESDLGDRRRAKFISWLDAQRFSDGGTPFAWAIVQYGDDEGRNRLTAHSNEKKRLKSGDLK